MRWLSASPRSSSISIPAAGTISKGLVLEIDARFISSAAGSSAEECFFSWVAGLEAAAVRTAAITKLTIDIRCFIRSKIKTACWRRFSIRTSAVRQSLFVLVFVGDANIVIFSP